MATGQSVESHRARYDRVPMNASCIAFNGSVIYDYETEKASCVCALPASARRMVEGLAEAFPGCFFTLQTLRGQYLCRREPDPVRKKLVEMFHLGGSQLPEVREDADAPWLKIAVTALSEEQLKIAALSEEQRRAMLREAGAKGKKVDVFRDVDPEVDRTLHEVQSWIGEHFPGEYACARSLPMMLEIQTAEASKGVAARRLANMLGRKYLVCVGDAPNDVGMLDEADEAYVAGDGDEELKRRGYRIAASSGEGTVASVIRRLMEENEECFS